MPAATRRVVHSSRARRQALREDDDDDAGTSRQASSSSRIQSNGRHDDEDQEEENANATVDNTDMTDPLPSSSSTTNGQADMSATQMRQQVTDLLEEFEREPHPISSNQHDQSIKSMHAEWKTMDSRVLRVMKLQANLAERKADLAKYAMDRQESMHGSRSDIQQRLQKETKELEDLDEGFAQLIDMHESVERSRNALQDIRNQLATDGDVVDAAGMYKRAVEEQTAAYNAKSRRARYGHNKEYEAYKQSVWAALHDEDEPMPPFNELLDGSRAGAANGSQINGSAGVGEDDDEDEDIVAYGASTAQTFKCPLSLQIMVDPVKSTVCVHAFERAAIHDYLRGHRSCPCPAQCSARLSSSTLHDDADFTRACRNYARRVERRRERDRMQQQSAILD